MYSIAALSALLCGRLIGGTLFVSILFCILGTCLMHTISGLRYHEEPLSAFLCFMVQGILAEMIAHITAESPITEAPVGAWVLFLPTLFFLPYTKGIPNSGRKAGAVLYSTLLMFLHIYAAAKDTRVTFFFLPMQLTALVTASFSVKRKNDA